MSYSPKVKLLINLYQISIVKQTKTYQEDCKKTSLATKLQNKIINTCVHLPAKTEQGKVNVIVRRLDVTLSH